MNTSSHQRIDTRIQLCGLIKHPPHIPRDPRKRLLKPLCAIQTLLDTEIDALHAPDEDRLDLRRMRFVPAAGSVRAYIRARNSYTYVVAYASGSFCVESPTRTHFRSGSHRITVLMRSSLYSCVPTVSDTRKLWNSIHDIVRRMTWPRGKNCDVNDRSIGYRLYGDAER